MSKKPKNNSKIIGAIFLLLPPLIFYSIWYLYEYEEVKIFNNLEVVGPSNLTLDEFGTLQKLANQWYEQTKNDSATYFNKSENKSDFGNFESKVSERLTEEFGIFASLPYHRVCLINRNKIYINGNPVNYTDLSVGAVGIDQEGGYKFYAERGGRDCRSVLIDRFRENSSVPELNYPIVVSVNPEENLKRLQGSNFLVNFATTTVFTAGTVVTVSLRWWVSIIFYFLILPVWSLLFFQYRKICLYLADNQRQI